MSHVIENLASFLPPMVVRHLLTDPRIGRLLVVVFWETEVDLLAGEIGYDEEQLASVSSLLAEPPAHEVYEVSVQVEITEQGSARVRGI